MGDHSAIEWTEATWNPRRLGATRRSPGCDHCYALTLAKRLKAMAYRRHLARSRRLGAQELAQELYSWLRVRPGGTSETSAETEEHVRALE